MMSFAARIQESTIVRDTFEHDYRVRDKRSDYTQTRTTATRPIVLSSSIDPYRIRSM